MMMHHYDTPIGRVITASKGLSNPFQLLLSEPSMWVRLIVIAERSAIEHEYDKTVTPIDTSTETWPHLIGLLVPRKQLADRRCDM
ncbi:MAG: hypothetical protein A49_24530 [Methyloceanibacter sp.]|nr:MAG: hypothetical protein A49_24530 [Methyloceanibacter sp.]